MKKHKKHLRIGLLLSGVLLFINQVALAHNKVVVVPLGADQAQVAISKTVFVTDGTFNSNFNGVNASGAKDVDALCQAEADAPGSQVIGKKFKAWVATELQDSFVSSKRFFDTSSTLPYIMVDGSLVANNFNQFLEPNGIQAPINVSAQGNVVTGETKVWTGVFSSGLFGDAGNTCGFWTINTGGAGAHGDLTQNDIGWTFDGTAACSGTVARLYCFEQ